MQKRLILLFVLITGAVICAPLFSGLWLKARYPDLIKDYDVGQNINVTLQNYHTGWFSSDAVLAVTIHDKKNPPLSFSVTQHILHGPYLFQPDKKFPVHFALAWIQNKIHLSKDTATQLADVGISDAWLQKNESEVTFAGTVLNYFKTGSVVVNVQSLGENIAVGGAEGMLSLNPREAHVNGNVTLYDLTISDPVNSVKFSKLTMQFDQHRDTDGIWLGSHSVDFPNFVFQTVNGDHVAVYGASLNGHSDNTSGEFQDSHKIDIQKIAFLGRNYGPVRMRFNANKFNVKIFQDMFSVYRDISENGELYQSEMQHKLMTLLPQIVIPGSSIQVDQLDVDSSKGNLRMNGVISWPVDDFITPDSVIDIGQSSTIQMKMNVSKPLVNDVIEYVSSMPDLIREASESDRGMLMEKKDQLDFCLRENVSLIAYLEQEQNITSSVADQLLSLQEQLVPLDSYTATVNQLYWDREITLAARIWLNWQYSQVIEPYQFMIDRMDVYQVKVKNEMQDEIKKLLTQHYVKQSDDMYSVQLNWSEGQLKLNGALWQ